MSLSFGIEDLLTFKWMCPLVLVVIQRGLRGLDFLGKKQMSMTTALLSLFYENCLTEVS